MSHRGLLIVIGLFIFDRYLKFVAVHLDDGFFILDRRLGFVFSPNSGIALSIPLPNMLSALIMIAFLLWIVWLIVHGIRTNKLSTLHQGALLAVFVGGVSNLFDRFAYGHVIDYLMIGFPWRALFFNVADVLVVCGVGVLLFDQFSLYGSQRSKKNHRTKS